MPFVVALIKSHSHSSVLYVYVYVSSHSGNERLFKIMLIVKNRSDFKERLKKNYLLITKILGKIINCNLHF